ncbi:MAG: type II 3-dehydroquinate dehydratase [Clostridiaceae bacterium]|nr:type II 3-dehydroquinate dehydratase [Clostridiaceae bacterium]
MPDDKKTAHNRLLLLHGPNLNMLGRRDPRQYGTFTLKDVETLVVQTAARYAFSVDCFQSNAEGDLIDRIQQAMDVYDGILINAGALTHTSYALRDAIELCNLPVLEIHISDIHKREPFRRISVIQPVCCGQIAGFGLDGYRMAADHLCRRLKGMDSYAT